MCIPFHTIGKAYSGESCVIINYLWLYPDICFYYKNAFQSKLTTCLCFVAWIQTDIDLHDGYKLDLNLQPKSGLEQDVEG